MLRLKSLEINGFRGYPKQITPLDLSSPAILIFGDNHQGKSTALNAIEWCLYGDQCVGTKSGIRERVGGWEIVNRVSEFAKVILTLETDQGDYVVKRAEIKGKGNRGKSIEVITPTEEKFKGNNAENEISSIVGLTFTDFSTTVYQHQETIRAVVVQTPKDRNDAIDRLLGLSDFRNILEGIKNAKLRNYQKELTSQFGLIKTRIEQAYKTRQGDLELKKDEAVQLGFEENKLNEVELVNLGSEIDGKLGKFASELNVGSSEVSVPSQWQEVKMYAINVSHELDRLWSESPDVTKQTDLNVSKSLIETEKSKIENCRNNISRLHQELVNFDSQHGNQKELKSQLLNYQSEIVDIESAISELSPNAKLIEEGVKLLESVSPEGLDNICPLCGKEEPDLLKHLQEKWKNEIEVKINELITKKKGIENQELAISKLIHDYQYLEQQITEEEIRYKDCIDNASDFFEKEITKDDDPIAILIKAIKGIDNQLIQISKAINDKREILNSIKEDNESMMILYEVIELEDRINRINAITETPEYQDLEKIIDDVSELIVDIEYLEKILLDSMNAEAQGRMDRAGNAINEYFKEITANPAIEKLRIIIEEDKRTGGNSYSFCDQNGDELTPILSQGDLNCLALSMFLGLVEAYSHSVGFVLLDDPSQSLGKFQKERLVQVLEKVYDNGRNLIVSTMDTDFQEFLESSFTKAKSIYLISNWNPNEGPEITKKL